MCPRDKVFNKGNDLCGFGFKCELHALNITSNILFLLIYFMLIDQVS